LVAWVAVALAAEVLVALVAVVPGVLAAVDKVLVQIRRANII
jgi:hypothetical protein